MTDYVRDPLPVQASALSDAQTDIKTAVKKGVLGNVPAVAIGAEVKKIVIKALSRIRSPTLKEDARVSLLRFADEVYGIMRRELREIPPEVLPFVCVLIHEMTEEEPKGEYFIPRTEEGRAAARALGRSGAPVFRTYQNGIPRQEFMKTYMGRVRAALDGVAQANARDPNDLTGRNSLRNLAEMQVRYEANQKSIEDLREKGVQLVVASSHADCSPRCAPWQGRVYSLDGTSGTTEDGRKYVPLEEATDVYYTTKAGRTYKNGLLGFNCRHFLTPYEAGMGIPHVTAEQRKEQYAITQTQRRMERAVIEAREKALANKGTDEALYKKWRKIAIGRNKAYRQYSEAHGRAFYPDRVKIL